MKKSNRFEELGKNPKPTTQKIDSIKPSYVKIGENYIKQIGILKNSRYIGFFPIN